jgi:hypothetical protein
MAGAGCTAWVVPCVDALPCPALRAVLLVGSSCAARCAACWQILHCALCCLLADPALRAVLPVGRSCTAALCCLLADSALRAMLLVASSSTARCAACWQIHTCQAWHERGQAVAGAGVFEAQAHKCSCSCKWTYPRVCATTIEIHAQPSCRPQQQQVRCAIMQQPSSKHPCCLHSSGRQTMAPTKAQQLPRSQATTSWKAETGGLQLLLSAAGAATDATLTHCCCWREAAAAATMMLDVGTTDVPARLADSMPAHVVGQHACLHWCRPVNYISRVGKGTYIQALQRTHSAPIGAGWWQREQCACRTVAERAQVCQSCAPIRTEVCLLDSCVTCTSLSALCAYAYSCVPAG